MLSHLKMGKEILTIAILKLTKINFSAIQVPFFRRCRYWEKVLVSSKISIDEKNYTYFVGYLYNDHKVKPLHIMLSKTNAYVKGYDGQTKWMYFVDWRWWLIRKL